MEAPKKKILIIDDDTFLLDMYALRFGQQSEYEVQASLGAKSAIEKIREGYHPDVILLDVVMPEMDGFDFLEALARERLVPDAIKIILSNRGQSADVVRGQALGVAGYIVKANTTPSEVVDRITTIVSKYTEDLANGKQ